jgi:hypothetical protein
VNRLPALTACLLTFALLAACTSQPIQRKDGTISQQGFTLTDLAKGDVDDVTEFSQRQILASLKTLTLKFYRRNPNEWRKSGFTGADDATAALFEPLAHWNVSPQRKLNWKASLADAWREDYAGDRVKALMSGLLVMQMAAFNNETEFYLLTKLDAQKLYNAARNTEAVVWKVSNARNVRGEPLLLSNGFDANGVSNLSFEREFGKLIGIEDTLALIIEDKTNREIRFGVVSVTKMIFLPI